MVSELPIEDPEFADIVTEFVERFRVKLTEMLECRLRNEWTELAQLAHWLAGAGGSAGFPLLTASARELESLLSQNQLDQVDDHLQRLGHLLLLITFGAPLTVSCRN